MWQFRVWGVDAVKTWLHCVVLQCQDVVRLWYAAMSRRGYTVICCSVAGEPGTGRVGAWEGSWCNAVWIGSSKKLSCVGVSSWRVPGEHGGENEHSQTWLQGCPGDWLLLVLELWVATSQITTEMDNHLWVYSVCHLTSRSDRHNSCLSVGTRHSRYC